MRPILNQNKKTAIIFDLDGCIADNEERAQKYLSTTPKEWSKFYADLSQDKLNEWCAVLARKLYTSYELIILTGRHEAHREKTEEWLAANALPYDKLIMRPDEDYSHDFEYKERVYKDELSHEYDILFAIDDAKRISELWHSLGITALQLWPGR